MASLTGTYIKPAFFVFDIFGNAYQPDDYNQIYDASGNAQSLDMYYSGATTNITTPFYYDSSYNFYTATLDSGVQQKIYNNGNQEMIPPLTDYFGTIIQAVPMYDNNGVVYIFPLIGYNASTQFPLHTIVDNLTANYDCSFNANVYVSGNVVGNLTGNVTGNVVGNKIICSGGLSSLTPSVNGSNFCSYSSYVSTGSDAYNSPFNLICQDSANNIRNQIAFFLNLRSGNYNPVVSNNDQAIIFNTSSVPNGFTIAPWSYVPFGLRFDTPNTCICINKSITSSNTNALDVSGNIVCGNLAGASNINTTGFITTTENVTSSRVISTYDNNQSTLISAFVAKNFYISTNLPLATTGAQYNPLCLAGDATMGYTSSGFVIGPYVGISPTPISNGIRMAPTGYIGINKTNPSVHLDISGNLNCSGTTSLKNTTVSGVLDVSGNKFYKNLTTYQYNPLVLAGDGGIIFDPSSSYVIAPNINSTTGVRIDMTNNCVCVNKSSASSLSYSLDVGGTAHASNIETTNVTATNVTASSFSFPSSVSNLSSGFKICTGIFSLGTVPTGFNTYAGPYSFGYTFSTAPFVFCQANGTSTGSGSAYFTLSVYSRTTTGFSLYCVNNSATSVTNSNIQWMAIG